MAEVLVYYQEAYSRSLIHDIAREYEYGGLDLADRGKYIKTIKDKLVAYAKRQPHTLDLKLLSKNFDSELAVQSRCVGRMNTERLDHFVTHVLLDMEMLRVRQDSAATTMPGNEVARLLRRAKSDKDFLHILSLITRDNVEDICRSFSSIGVSIDKKRLVLPELRAKVIAQIVKHTGHNRELQANVAGNYLIHNQNSDTPVDPTEILRSMEPDNIFELLAVYERNSHIRNMTWQEMQNSERGLHRPGTEWPQTLMQAIVNNQCITPKEKKAALFAILDKAVEASPYRVHDSLYVDQLRRKAASQILKCRYRTDSNVDYLNILVCDILGDHKMFVRNHFNARDAIIRRDE